MFTENNFDTFIVQRNIAEGTHSDNIYRDIRFIHQKCNGGIAYIGFGGRYMDPTKLHCSNCDVFYQLPYAFSAWFFLMPVIRGYDSIIQANETIIRIINPLNSIDKIEPLRPVSYMGDRNNPRKITLHCEKKADATILDLSSVEIFVNDSELPMMLTSALTGVNLESNLYLNFKEKKYILAILNASKHGKTTIIKEGKYRLEFVQNKTNKRKKGGKYTANNLPPLSVVSR